VLSEASKGDYKNRRYLIEYRYLQSRFFTKHR
jgi:hypothetical protein